MALNSCRNALSFAHGSSSLSRSRSVIHVSPMVLVMSPARSGLACTSQRRGVTPFVLLLKRSGQRA